jgi:hypothetical protein
MLNVEVKYTFNFGGPTTSTSLLISNIQFEF